MRVLGEMTLTRTDSIKKLKKEQNVKGKNNQFGKISDAKSKNIPSAQSLNQTTKQPKQ
jgi:hypothetical protein